MGMELYQGVGVALGLVVLAAFFQRGRKTRRFPTLTEGVVVFLACNGVVMGVRVCEFALRSTCIKSSDATAIFVGGLAVAWVAVETIVRNWRQHSDKPKP